MSDLLNFKHSDPDVQAARRGGYSSYPYKKLWKKITRWDLWFNVPFTGGRAGVYAFLEYAWKHCHRGIGVKAEFDKRGSSYRAGWHLEVEIRLWWRNLSIGLDWDGETEKGCKP